MKIAIQDANILFDMIDGGFADLWFALGIETHTTDLVLNEIKEKKQKKVVKLYINSGKLIIDSFDDLSPVIDIYNKAPGLSIQDCSVLYLSECLDAVLLTGDRELRAFATGKSIEVHGTLWMLDCMIESKILEPLLAIDKLQHLLQIDRRLPQAECEQRIKEWQKSKTK